MTLNGFAGSVLCLAFSPDGKRLAMTGQSPIARVWDAETGREVLQLKGHTDSVAAIAFSPDGSSLATGGYDKTVIFWPAFPWQQDSYPCPSSASLQERIELFKRDFWKNQIAAAYTTASIGPEVPSEGTREDGRPSLQLCAKNLRRIHAGLARYRAQHNDQLPGWLSDLVPVYVSSDTLLCPLDPIGKANFYPDPGLPCSFSYQFSDTPVKGYTEGGAVDHAGLTSRLWKTRQLERYGDIVPTVRCNHHRDDPLVRGGVFNLSFGGRLYFSPLAWETGQKIDYETGQKIDYPTPASSADMETESRAQQLVQCVDSLQRIHTALVRWRAEHNNKMPNWLSDLVPQYITTATLSCPAAPAGYRPSVPDPRLPCSYNYQFSPLIATARLAPANTTNRDWKMQQLKEFGDIVPTVRCDRHGSRVLNLSYGGKLFWSAGQWEKGPREDYVTTGSAARPPERVGKAP
jgi:hypothetical protein